LRRHVRHGGFVPWRIEPFDFAPAFAGFGVAGRTGFVKNLKIVF
jgi:hypothetical protein